MTNESDRSPSGMMPWPVETTASGVPVARASFTAHTTPSEFSGATRAADGICSVFEIVVMAERQPIGHCPDIAAR